MDRLFATCTLADGHRPVGEHTYLALLSNDPSASMAFVGESNGEIISYVHLTANREARGWTFESAVHPAHRSQDYLTDLASVAVDTATRQGGQTLRTWIYNATWPVSLAALGFVPDRELRQLRASIPLGSPSYPAGVERRLFRPGVDEDAWLALNNAAFEGHPENGSWDNEILEDRQAQPWWDPAGIVMAWRSSELVGFCWTKDHGDGVGEIYIVGVSPDARRLGLGRALTLDGLEVLAEQGCSTGMLYVDAANRPALGMYEELGFTLHHIDQSMIVTL